MEDAARADVGKLERECPAVIERQKRHKLLLLPGLESFRSSLVDDTQDSCGFKLATMRAIKDAAALRDYKPALPACAEYVDALEGKTDLDLTWTAIVEASCRQNASPEACRNRDRAEAQKPDGLERKRLLVLNFGWNNCAVPFMRMNALSDKRDKMRDAIAKKLKRNSRSGANATGAVDEAAYCLAQVWISNSPLISTGIPCGSSARPTADRACWPILGPSSS